MKTYLTHFLLILSIIVYGQTGPGGVGSSDGSSTLEYWVDANNSVTNSEPITTWLDISGNGITNTILGNPKLTTNSLNGYNVITFDGNDYISTNLNINQATFPQLDIYAVYNLEGNSGSIWGEDNGGYDRFLTDANGAGGCDFAVATGTGCSNNAALFPFSTPVITSIQFSEDVTNGSSAIVNGTNLFSFTSNHGPEVSNNLDLASIGNGGYLLTGDIAEVFVFGANLNSAQQIIIHNYLSSKYNITLTGNDIYDEDETANGNYDHDVAGIGRIDASNIHNDAQGTGIIRILNPIGLGNDEFLIWGHNNGTQQTVETTDIPTDVQARFDRVWRVSEVNTSGVSIDVGAIDIQFDLTDLGIVAESDLRLLIDTDNDGVFIDETPIYGATLVSGNIYQFAGVTSISNNLRFTLGTQPTVLWDGGAGTQLWEDPLNWSGNVLPTASDIAIIPDGITIKVSTAGAVCQELKIGNSSEFEVMTTGELTIGSDMDLQSVASINIIKGIVNLGGEIINDGSASIVFSTNSTMNYNGNSSQTVSNKNYYNLTLSSSGTKNLTGTTGVSGTFTNSATIGTNTGTIDYNGSGVQTITSFDYNNLTISGDKASNTITFASALGISGTLSLTATNVTYDLLTNTSTVSYNGSSSQTIQNIPDCYYNLVCENGVKQFVENIEVKNDVLIASSGTIQTAGNELTIGRHFTNNGTFTPSSLDIVRFSGTNLSTVTGTITFENLNINKTNSSVDINGIVSIASSGAIRLENGTSTLSVSGSLTLLSTSGINTARIAEIPSGSSVSGNITIQRYVPISSNALGWWHLSNTVQGVSVSNWQSFLKISGVFTGRDSIPGSMATSKDNWSLKTYDESQLTSEGVFNDGWKNFPTSINTETFTNGKGYRLYLVDSRTASSAKTFTFTGAINQGEFTFPMTYTNSGVSNSEGYAFLGNPYPSAIDFSEGNWTKTNVTNAMYIWDAQFKVWRGWINGSNYNGGSPIIPAGQGFWVQATGTPILKVKESAKVSNTISLQRTGQVENNISVSLEVKGSDDLVTTDIRISDLATAGYDEEYDMAYLSRNLFSEFNSIPLLDIASETKDGKKVFINNLPISGEEIIPLHITTTIGNEHVLTITKENYSLNSQVYLVDNVLNTEVLVEDVISYSFDSKLGTKDRFSVKIDNRIVLETEDFVENGQYFIYPNPASSKGFTVKGTQSYEDVTITVTDVLGNTMYKSTVENNESGFEKHVKFNNSLKAGVYFVIFTTSNNENIQKVIIE